MRLLPASVLVLVAALFTNPAPVSLATISPAAAAPRVAVRAPAHVQAGTTVTFTGTVVPRRRTTLVLQRRVGTHWVRTRAGHSTRAGRFRLATTAVAGRARYRVVTGSGRASRPLVVTGIRTKPSAPKPDPVPAGAPRMV